MAWLIMQMQNLEPTVQAVVGHLRWTGRPPRGRVVRLWRTSWHQHWRTCRMLSLTEQARDTCRSWLPSWRYKTRNADKQPTCIGKHVAHWGFLTDESMFAEREIRNTCWYVVQKTAMKTNMKLEMHCRHDTVLKHFRTVMLKTTKISSISL